MKHIQIALLSIFTIQSTMLLPNPWRTDASDCLRLASEATSYIDASYPEGWSSNNYKKWTQQLKEEMRNCNCEQRAAALDRYTNIHRRVESKCVELSDKARRHIDNNDPRAIPTMQIIHALGCRYIHNPNNPELQRVRQQATQAANNHQGYWWETETERARNYRLLKETVCGK